MVGVPHATSGASMEEGGQILPFDRLLRFFYLDGYYPSYALSLAHLKM